jgi:hypothetical protein
VITGKTEADIEDSKEEGKHAQGLWRGKNIEASNAGEKCPE